MYEVPRAQISILFCILYFFFHLTHRKTSNLSFKTSIEHSECDLKLMQWSRGFWDNLSTKTAQPTNKSTNKHLCGRHVTHRNRQATRRPTCCRKDWALDPNQDGGQDFCRGTASFTSESGGKDELKVFIDFIKHSRQTHLITSRCFQLDAGQLDAEVVRLLKAQLCKAFQYFEVRFELYLNYSRNFPGRPDYCNV